MYKMIATCPEETKDALVLELEELGCMDIEPSYRSVRFSVDDKQFYLVHLKLRTASRIMMVVKRFAAKHKSMLFDQTRRIKWPDIFASHKTFIVDGVPGDRGPKAMDGTRISMTIREAIEDSFTYNKDSKPRVNLKEPDVRVVGFLKGGWATISIDTTGLSLYKRGYKNDNHPAPLKETLAAAVLNLAGYDGTQTLYDPMCGSGTFVIEGAAIALNKAAQIHRKDHNFAFQGLKMYDSKMWREVQEFCRSEKLEKPLSPIFAGDIEGRFIGMAKDNALRGRVERHIDFQEESFFDAKKPAPHGILVCNLPYGERISPDDEDMKNFYKEIGDKLKSDFKGWKAYLLCHENSPYKHIGLKPGFKRSILNGSIPVKLLGFELFAGSHKEHKMK